ncbi:hypothetical protein HPG69_012293 [Diceros bicornis minor]|uniref:Uncharacterized protein n=1 Tax=Diceros bicornis minor TaxID=77932 RepID=A0A7J7F5A0_DICBM|nr:hypothetical protein HPG69_012293 [Diceros bicornis minor]
MSAEPTHLVMSSVASLFPVYLLSLCLSLGKFLCVCSSQEQPVTRGLGLTRASEKGREIPTCLSSLAMGNKGPRTGL